MSEFYGEWSGDEEETKKNNNDIKIKVKKTTKANTPKP
tara:strand:- start:278 stop:391 length:114 start_codon:yes stop_codon:yes gene_type:complete